MKQKIECEYLGNGEDVLDACEEALLIAFFAFENEVPSFIPRFLGFVKLLLTVREMMLLRDIVLENGPSAVEEYFGNLSLGLFYYARCINLLVR